MPQIFLLLSPSSHYSQSPVSGSRCVLRIGVYLGNGIDHQHPHLECTLKIADVKTSNISPEASQSACKGGKAAFDLLRKEGYIRKNLQVVYQLPIDAINQHGTSSDLAFALAFIVENRIAEKTLNIAATGEIDEGSVKAVGHIENKLHYALAELPEHSLIFLPAANEDDVPFALQEQCAKKHIRLYFISRLEEACDVLDIEVQHYYRDNPFPGLNCFELKHASLFFGRDVDIKRAGEKIHQRYEQGFPSLLVVGDSGTGKSSFAQAGLLKEIIRGALRPEYAHAIYSVFRPRQLLQDRQSEAGLPGTRLWKHLSGHWSGNLAVSPADDIADQKSARYWLQHALQSCPQSRLKGDVVYIWIVDQLEEVFTLGWDKEEQQQFLALLAHLPAKNFWLIATLRSDFYPECQRHSEFISHFQNQGRYRLLEQDSTALRSIICKPARLAELNFEEQDNVKLEERILEAVDHQPKALPLLQLTLSQLYEQRNKADKQLTVAAYHKMGGVDGAIRTWAQAVYEQLPDEKRQYFKDLLRCLAIVDGRVSASNSRITARAVLYEKLPERTRPLVDSLVDSRLLVKDSNCNGQALIKVTHEALLRNWPLVQEQITDEQDDFMLSNHLQQCYSHYKAFGQKEDQLIHRGTSLQKARALQKSWRDTLPPDVDKYITISFNKVCIFYTRIAIVFSFLILVVGIFLYLFFIQNEMYYLNIDRSSIIPIAKGEMSTKDHKNNDRHYKIIRNAGRLGDITSIMMVNRHDECPYDNGSLIESWIGEFEKNEYGSNVSICEVDYTYETDNLGKETAYFLAMNNPHSIMDPSSNKLSILTYSGLNAEYSIMNFIKPKTDAVIIKFDKEKDRSNKINRISFWKKEDYQELKATDQRGVHEYFYEYKKNVRYEMFDNSSIESKLSYGNICDEKIPKEMKNVDTINYNKAGIHKIKKTYNYYGMEIDVSYWDKGNIPLNFIEEVEHKYIHFHQKIISYDVYGNVEKIKYFYKNETSPYIIQSFKRILINNNYLTEVSFYEKNRKYNSDDKNYFNLVKRKFDDHGRTISIAYYQKNSDIGKEKQVMVDFDQSNGYTYHMIKSSYENKCNAQDIGKQNPCFIKNNIFFDKNEQALLVGDSFHIEKNTYNSKMDLLSVSYYDMANKRVLHKKNGYHSWEINHNPTEGVIENHKFLDVEGHISHLDDILYAYTQSEREVDRRGNVTAVVASDENGRVTFKSKRTYDHRDNQTSISYFDGNKNPIADPTIKDKPSQVWLVCKAYNHAGQESVRINVGINGNLVMNGINKKEENFATRYQYYTGNEISPYCTVKFDANNKLTSSDKDCSAKQRKYLQPVQVNTIK